MKNPNTGKTFLDVDEINTLLPSDLQIVPKRVNRSIFQTENGTLITISNSKVYETIYSICWYFVYADRYLDMGVKYMIFTVGMEGIILLPIEKIKDYKRGCSWKDGSHYNEKRYRIDIKRNDDGTLAFVNHSEIYDNYLDVTPYFIPFKQ